MLSNLQNFSTKSSAILKSSSSCPVSLKLLATLHGCRVWTECTWSWIWMGFFALGPSHVANTVFATVALTVIPQGNTRMGEVSKVICFFLNKKADDMDCLTVQPQHLLGSAIFRMSQHAVLPCWHTYPVSDGKAEQCDKQVMSIFSGQRGSCERQWEGIQSGNNSFRRMKEILKDSADIPKRFRSWDNKQNFFWL